VLPGLRLFSQVLFSPCVLEDPGFMSNSDSSTASDAGSTFTQAPFNVYFFPREVFPSPWWTEGRLFSCRAEVSFGF